MPIVFKPNGNWDRAFNSPGGMVGRDLRHTARETERYAKIFVGRKTGTLKQSIRAGYPVPTPPKGLIVEVKASADHALLHHQGTKSGYVIRPKTKKSLSFQVKAVKSISMRLSSKKRGKPRNQITVKSVNHPRIAGNKYLTKALRVATQRYRARGTP